MIFAKGSKEAPDLCVGSKKIGLYSDPVGKTLHVAIDGQSVATFAIGEPVHVESTETIIEKKVGIEDPPSDRPYARQGNTWVQIPEVVLPKAKSVSVDLSEYVKTDDLRLKDSRHPSKHTHKLADIADLPEDLKQLPESISLVGTKVETLTKKFANLSDKFDLLGGLALQDIDKVDIHGGSINVTSLTARDAKFCNSVDLLNLEAVGARLLADDQGLHFKVARNYIGQDSRLETAVSIFNESSYRFVFNPNGINSKTDYNDPKTHGYDFVVHGKVLIDSNHVDGLHVNGEIVCKRIRIIDRFYSAYNVNQTIYTNYVLDDNDEINKLKMDIQMLATHVNELQEIIKYYNLV